MRALRAPSTPALALLIALLLAPLLWLAPAPAAQADEPPGWASVSLTSLKPAVPNRDGTVTVKGTVTNISNQPLSNLQAVLWRYRREPLRDSDDLAAALGSPAGIPLGERLFDRDYQNIPSETERTLAPGASTRFALRTRIANLGFPDDEGVYLFGVHIRGRLPGDPRDLTLGRARTFLPLVSERVDQTLTLTSLVILSSQPSLIRPGLLSDEHLASEFGPDGRLSKLLTAADSDDVSFAVDPALVDEARSMRTGYQVLDSAGQLIAGRGADAASVWLDRLNALVQRRDGYRLLFGSPDVTALVHSGQQTTLAASARASRNDESVGNLPLLVFPTSGAADAATIDAVETLSPKAIVLTGSTVIPEEGPLLRTSGGTPLVTSPPTGFSGGPGPDPRNTPVQIRQRALAQSWLEATTAEQDAAHGRVRVITSAAQAVSDEPGADAPWMQRRPLRDLLADGPSGTAKGYRYSAMARDRELTAGQLGSVAALATSLTTYSELLVDANATATQRDRAAARAASGYWRRHLQAQQAVIRPQRAFVDEILNERIKLSSNPRVRTVARDGVEFPITIRNTLPQTDPPSEANTVRVRVVFSSDNRQRLTIRPIEDLRVRAGENLTANASVTARANGVVPVTARLTTMAGTPIGKPIDIAVEVTQNGTTGWAIAVAAGVVLVATTALRIRQVARERSSASATDGHPDEASAALSSARVPVAERSATSAGTGASADRPPGGIDA